MVCALSPPRDAPDLPPPALGLGSPGRIGPTQGLGWGAGPRWPPLPGEQLWVEVPRPLTQASGSEGHREAAAVAAGRRGSVEGVSRDQGPAGRRGCRGGRGRGSKPGPSLSPPPPHGARAQPGWPSHRESLPASSGPLLVQTGFLRNWIEQKGVRERQSHSHSALSPHTPPHSWQGAGGSWPNARKHERPGDWGGGGGAAVQREGSLGRGGQQPRWAGEAMNKPERGNGPLRWKTDEGGRRDWGKA